MRAVIMKSALIKSALAASVLLLGAGAHAQQTINLTAGPTSTTLPDGMNVPMWGYSCGAAVSGSTATCAALNPNAAGGWSPIVITVPYGQSLTINLTNNLSFTPTGSTTPNNIPTSLVIPGQIGGGLGTPVSVASPPHAPYGNTWFVAGTTAGATFNPPAQGNRVQSFGTEVQAGAGATTANTAALTWTAPKPGTYLIESGTHPSIQVPMGLYGMVVVTQAPTLAPPAAPATTSNTEAAGGTGCAYPSPSSTGIICASSTALYDADIDFLTSEIDPLQNNAVQTAVGTAGFSEISTQVKQDTLGTVAIVSGGTGYTTADTVNVIFASTATCTTPPTAAIGSVDSTGAITLVNVTNPGSGCTAEPIVTVTPNCTPVSPATTCGGTGANLTPGLALAGVACSGNAGACYPPAINYTPLYFLVNGAPFNKTAPANSVYSSFPVNLAADTSHGESHVLVRLANAGLRMHVPAILNALTGGNPAVNPPVAAIPGVTLVAEDGNPIPGTARIQSEVFLPAGKTQDVLITPVARLTSFTNLVGGAGYSGVPTVALQGGGGSGATAVASVGVGAIVVGANGSGYTVPVVTIVPAAGNTVATAATATASGGVTNVNITAGGSLYSSGTTASFSAPPAGGTAAQAGAVTVTSGIITALAPTAPGQTLTLPLTVTGIADTAPGTGSGAAATAAIDPGTGNIVFTITNGGANYVTPVVTVTDSSTTPVVLALTPSATIANGVITAVAVASAGSGYTAAPSVSFTDPATTGSGAAASSGINVTAITMNTVGTGYIAEPTVTITDASGTGSGAAGTASLSVVSIAVTAAGTGYTSAPMVTIDAPVPPAGVTGATAAATANVTAGGTLPIFDRQLALSGNAVNRDSGMLAYLSIGAATLPTGSGTIAALTAAVAVSDTYNSVIGGKTVSVTDPSKGVLANDTNVFGAKIVVSGVAKTGPVAGANGTITLNPNGTFTYAANATGVPTTGTVDSFMYCGNGTLSGAACATITLGAAPIEAGSGVVAANDSYTSTVLSTLSIHGPGVLANDVDHAGYPLTVKGATNGAPLVAKLLSGTTSLGNLVTVFPDGGFTISGVTSPGTYTFTYQAVNSQGTPSNTATVSVTFPAASNLQVTVLDPVNNAPITDYRWIIEEDQTFFVDPNCTTNPVDKTKCTTVTPQGAPFGFGTNFHTSHMPVVAAGCTGSLSCESGQTLQGVPAVCDIGNGVCRTSAAQQSMLQPSQVNLDPTKRYYISVLPGDASNPFAGGYASTPVCSTAGTPNGTCGHGMGGVAIPAPCLPKTIQSSCTSTFAPVTVLTQPSPYPTGKLTVHVFEDDFPLDGIFSPGGGVDVVAPNEPGLGGFSIVLLDAGGGPGDATGQVTYDMFNQPLSNSLAGMIDPVTGNDACPLSTTVTQNVLTTTTNSTATPYTPGSQAGVMGMIVTCPKYESDGKTLSPMAGMAVIANLPPARYAVVANPGADRIAAGEEWLQTNTLDGQKGHDSFIRIGEPAYFQEFGPSGFHVDIGFANPAIINARRSNAQGTGMCDPAATGGTAGTNVVPGGGGLACNNTVTGHVTNSRLSRAPDQRIYGSRTRQSLAFTQCYVSLGDPDGFDFAFAKCDADGNFTFTGIPAGNWKITTFDQWNDQIIDGITTSVGLNCPSGTTASGLCTPANATGIPLNMGEIAAHQWQANIYTRTFLDLNGNGMSDKDAKGNDTEPGLPLENVNNRWRDGSFSNFNSTDLNGYANYNEVFPLFNWYVFEGYTTRYKTTGVHVVMDAGGPVDVPPAQSGTLCNTTLDANGNAANGDRPCGASNIAANMANTYDFNPLPADIALPGAIYCGLGASADCAGKSLNPALSNKLSPITGGWSNLSDTTTCTPNTTPAGTVLGVNCTPLSTGRIDPPYWFGSYGWQGFIGQNQWLEFGKAPFVPGETGGIRGHVIYASTRPFDDPQLLLQNQWEPLVPRVTINLYQEGAGPDGSPTLTLVDHTTTSSFDDWVQGFRSDGKPNISCPGQSVNDNLFYALANQPTYLDWYNNVLHGTATAATALPYNSQFKCYDGMHSWNQLQPVPYDGLYVFPSVTGIDPKTGRPNGTNCTVCTTNVDANDSFRYGGSTTPAAWVNGASQGTPVLPAGKYVVEVVVPPGYELVKEEDKNILIGDNFTAPAAVQFPGLGGNIFILPDMATLAAVNASNPPNLSNNLGGNPLNPQNPTNNLGRTVSEVSHEGDTHSVETYWPCVGALRQVPDYISLFPNSAQVAPFAGAWRNLCDRKEVVLTDQSSATAKFYIFTSTHVASHFTGVILDDFTGEFDPFSPQWGEKFAPAYIPVSVKDWQGNETNRVYSDEFGLYNGLNYSTWEVNPPNPTGYSPTMMVMCMNDSGHGTKSPWWDTAAAGKISANPDPFFQPGYSTFCYELAFMPGQTGYFDTPVVPVASFSEGYNHPDCAYPDTTPAVREVDGDGIGPWVAASGAGHTLKIYALGDQTVDNYGYSGPSATIAPFNQQRIKRHYGFGTAPSTNCGTNQPCAKLVTPDGVSHPLTGVTWSDTQITGTVPTWTCNAAGTNCPLQQQAAFATVGNGAGTVPTPIQSAQLVITAANGRSSTDAVTVWIGGKAPSHVDASSTIQAAIDAAAPGDLIIVDPTCTGTTAVNGTLPLQTCSLASLTAATQTRTTVAHNEMVQMYKPVRLQGAGAASAIIDANTQPAGKLLDPWRQRINCAVGLTPQGRPRAFTDTACSSGWAYSSGGPDYPTMIADRLPFEAMLGWDASLNGNVAEQLIEPSLLGAYEGAAITVLAKGVKLPPKTDPQFAGLSDAQILAEVFGAGTTNVGAAFPTNTNLLLPADCAAVDPATSLPTYPTSFYCNPSAIDGLGIRDSSQGGGGIFVHAYGHYLQIANNRVYNNSGTMGGGISVGLGEHADAQQVGSAPTQYPGSCDTTTTAPTGMLLPYCYNMYVNVHHNMVTLNSSMGDELFSSTPAGAGGIVLSTGDDNYKVTNNWVCGNLSVGDGGGMAAIGFSNNGTIANNTIIFNESTNPTITTHGGGLLLMGAPDADPTTCGVTTDIDCVPPPGTISPSDGIGRNIRVNANLILGNSAASGSGGGLRLQHVNGMDVVDVPNGATVCASAANCAWNSATVTNNIIANNVAGWDGAGVSLQDTLVANIVNNTIVSNDSTASSGTLLTSLFSQSASAAPDPLHNCVTNAANATATGSSNGASCAQVAGLVATTNSPVLMANLRSAVDAGQLTCPAGHGGNVAAASGPAGFNVPTCFYYSIPQLTNDMIWDNHSYYIGVGGRGAGQQNKQNVVTLYQAFTNAAAPSQPTTPAVARNGTGETVTGGTGACSTVGAQAGVTNFWEIGVRGDTAPSVHGTYSDSDSLFTAAVPLTLSPTYSLLSDGTTDYGPTATTHNVAGDPQLAQLYCNGSRTPPENQAGGYLVPAGTIESNGLPNPVFTLTPSAVVDEGNNWVNLRWGPLSLVDPATGVTLGNFNLTSGSAARTAGLNTATAVPATTTDFFGRARPTAASGSAYDIGAVEYAATAVSTLTVSCDGTGSTTLLTTPCAGLNFGNVGTGSSATLTLNVYNATGGALADLYATGFTGPFARSTSSPGTCASTLAASANCSINVVFTPAAAGAASGEASVNASFPVNGSPVPLSGTGVLLPTLTSISPSTATRGNTTAVTLNGSNFTGASAITVSGTGVTCTITGTATATQVGANCAVTATAALTGRSVTVTTPSGTSNAVTLTVANPGAPTLAAISPNSGVRGTAVAVALTGTNFTTTGTTVAVSGAGVTVSGVSVTSSTTLTATFTITTGAAISARNVTVTSPAGTSGAVTFAVQGATLASIAPATGVRGTTVPVTLTGANLGGATGLAGLGTGITVQAGSLVANATTVNATLVLAAGATLGAHNIDVVTNIGTTNTVAFTVTGATLTISAPTPAMTTSTGNTTTKNAVITVTNTATGANAGAFTFAAAPGVTQTAGATGTSFSVTGGTCANGLVLNAGATGNSCTINVQYLPGTSTATSTAHVVVTGTGISPNPQSGANFNAN